MNVNHSILCRPNRCRMAPVRVDRQHDRQQDFLHSHHHARSAGYISLFEAMGIVAGTDRTISLSTRSMT